jgi:IS30 family transposase
MSHKQITPAERYLIHHHLRQGFSKAEIARKLTRHRGTIYREISRNLHIHSYLPDIAQEHADGRRSRSRKRPQFSPEQWVLVCCFLQLDWSPEQVSLVFRWRGALSISHETIYRYIWRDKRNGGNLYKHLRQSCKRRRKRYRANDSRGILRGKRDISERPAAAEKRLEKGHFEVDLMHGARAKACILTLVDRKTRLVLIRKLRDKSMKEVKKALVLTIRRYKIRTLTADNGSEFHDYERIERLTGAMFYFAKPYHSWERGTCENTNGLIRQYLPKWMSMSRLTQLGCNAIAEKLNDRPRKVLNLLCPEEAYYDL